MATTQTNASEGVTGRTAIAVGGALLGAFMAVLDIQITNSSLLDIEGGIGTGGANGTWISTAYLIGEIIVIPMTDFLSRVFTLRRYLIGSVLLFLVFSAACGQARSLTEMIAFRGLQGFFGGAMIPLAFTIIVSMLPPKRRPIGFAGFAITATFAPSIGPTIGGWLTDTYGWPSIFYLGLVPGVVMLGMLTYALPKSEPRLALLRRGDWPGIALMAVGLATLQTVLDEGNVHDWFGSPLIVRLSLVSAAALLAFVALELRREHPLIPLHLLTRRNFGFGTACNFLLGFALYGSAYLLPQYLAVSQHLNAQQSGQVMAWTGLPQLFVIPLVPLVLMPRFDSRLIVATGLAIFAVSCFMNLHLDPDYAGPQLFAPDVTRALGQALVMAPLSGIAMVGITKDEAGGASGLFNMLRNLGGAVGVAITETFFTKREQFHSFVVNSHVSVLEPATRERLADLQRYFETHGMSDPQAALSAAVDAVGRVVRAQATLMGYADSFGLIGAVLVCGCICVLLLKKGSGSAEGAH